MKSEDFAIAMKTDIINRGDVKVMWLVRVLLVLFTFHFSLFTSMAQTLTASAPSQVAVGEQFRLTYTINTQNVSDFRAGNIPEELEVLIGPNRSMQSSYQMINGHTSSSSSITYTYIVVATKNGSFTIPAAHAVVDGKSIASNAVKITVSGNAQSHASGGGGQQRQRGDEGAELRDAGSRISGSDLFIKVSANKCILERILRDIYSSILCVLDFLRRCFYLTYFYLLV